MAYTEISPRIAKMQKVTATDDSKDTDRLSLVLFLNGSLKGKQAVSYESNTVLPHALVTK